MSDGVWRNFRFFESEPLPPSSPLGELNVVCSCLTPTAIVVGDYEGQVFFVDRSAASSTILCSFQAYAGAVTHIRYAALRNTLITIGDDDALNTAILRVWELDQLMHLYRGLMDHHPSTPAATSAAGTNAAAATTALRWRPPCQEHRLLTPPKSAVAGGGPSTAAEDLPLVPILLQETKQLQYTFQSNTASSSRASLPSPPPASPASAAAAVSCGSIRSAVVSVDVASDLSCAAVGLVSRDCVVLTGDLAKARSVRAQTIRSGLAKGALTFVGLPAPHHATLLGDGGPRGAAAHGSNTEAITTNTNSGAAAVAGGSSSGRQGEGGGGFFGGSRAGGGTAGKGKVDGAASAPLANAPPPVQLLYTVHEDVVTCWALRANGNWSEYPCPTVGGAPRCGAALTSRGELLVLGRQSATHAAGSRVMRLGLPVPVAETADSAAAVTAARQPYDPTVKACVQTIDVDHAPGRCFLYTYRHYLVLVVQQEGRPEHFQMQCYDLLYKIRGLSRPQENYVNCATVLADESELMVLFQDPAARTKQLALRGVRLREVSTQTKLELLFSKECYGIAQQLAQTVDGGDPSLQMRIRKKYGDYLYHKGKFSEAMAQYVETIGHLESSYVIRRYMGSAHMEDLIRYLEELHHQRHSAHANVAHTTLLLRCYRKRNDAARLHAFVHRDDVRFDPQNAVAVCREGGYAAAALYVADRYAQVYDCARIRLYDLHEPLATLAYLRTLGVDEVEGICAQLGKDLLALAPRATTELLMELCVYWKGPGRRLVDTAGGVSAAAGAIADFPTPLVDGAALHTAGGLLGGGPRHTHHANAAAFLHIFVDAPVCLMNFLRAVVESGVLDEDDETGKEKAVTAAETQQRGGGVEREVDKEAVDASAVSPHAVLYNTLLELYMTRNLKSTLQLVPPTALARHGSSAAATTGDSLCAFSPAAEKKRDGPSTAAAALATSAADGFPVEPYERRLEQARTFLEAYKGRYDHYLALSLAHQHHFQDGILYLLRSLGLSEEILGYYSAQLNDPQTTPLARQEAAQKLFQACQAAPGNASATTAMWMSLLSQLVRTPQTAWQDIVKVLDYIEAHDALSPVVVLEILSSHPQNTLQLRTVRDYCQRCLLKQTRQVRDVLTQTTQRLGEVERVKAEVTALQTAAVVFQTTSCAHCHQPLDAPTVYFMCKHAFHHRCLYTATECNVCAAAHRRQLDGIRETQRRDGQRQNPSSFTAQYFQDVKAAGAGGATSRLRSDGQIDAESPAAHATERGTAAADGFEVVVGYVARGILGAPPLYKDAGLFGVETAVPLRNGGDARRDAEETLDVDELDVW